MHEPSERLCRNLKGYCDGNTKEMIYYLSQIEYTLCVVSELVVQIFKLPMMLSVFSVYEYDSFFRYPQLSKSDSESLKRYFSPSKKLPVLALLLYLGLGFAISRVR